MSAYKVLDAYFKARDFEGHYDTVKSVQDYAKKVEKKKDEKSWWDNIKFINNEVTDKATKGIRKALKIYEDAEKGNLDWPGDDTSLFFNSMLKAADKHGAKSRQYNVCKKNYENKLIFFDQQLKSFLSELETRSGYITKHLKMANGSVKYANVLEGVFVKLSKYPTTISTAPQAEWFSLSQDASQFAGLVGNCASSLQRLGNTNSNTVKDCKYLINSNKTWISWIKSDSPDKSGVLKKNAKAKTPKK